MTPERKKKLRTLLRKKAAEELKKEQERKAEERLRVIAERCGTKADIDNASVDDLKKICTEEIISKFSERAVLDQEAIIDFPEMALELWKLFEERKKICHTNRGTSSEDNMASSFKIKLII